MNFIDVALAHMGEEGTNNVNMMGGNMGYMMTGSWGWSMMIFGWAIGILTLVLMVLLIMWLVKQIQK